jgi:MSHA pilin protein MshA
MRRQSGFTLIELVVVIVILGILAATAAPKFMDLQVDARKSALNGLAGAVKSAATMTYSKAILKGVESEAKSASIYICSVGTSTCGDSDKVYLAYGKPTAQSLITSLDLSATDLSTSTTVTGEWAYFVNDTVIYIYTANKLPNPATSAPSGDNFCGVRYTEATGVDSDAKVEVITDAC